MTDEVLQDFQKELDILGKLRHPNVVLLMGACTQPPNLCMVTEFLNGGSLFDALYKRKQQFPTPTIMKMAYQSAAGLNYLHLGNPPIIHRDFKSMNLLLDNDSNVKICDFGLSCVKKNEDVTTVVGSPFWMAPEVWMGQSYGPKADVYSFGVVFFETMTGTIPFSEVVTSDPASMQELQRLICFGQRAPIPAYVLPSIATLISRCWAPCPDERPSFEEIIPLLEEITESLAQQPSSASPFPNYYFDPASQQYLPVATTYYNAPSPQYQQHQPPQYQQQQYQQQYQHYMQQHPF
jgi:serine/threonine protein kinase